MVTITFVNYFNTVNLWIQVYTKYMYVSGFGNQQISTY